MFKVWGKVCAGKHAGAGLVVTGIGSASLVACVVHTAGYSKKMDTKSAISEFFKTRRSHLTPEQAGVPVYGFNRRVSGLRREEVALLAGVSVDYYTRIERGNVAGVSISVLDALSRALQLTEVEREHLYRLANLANTRKTVRGSLHQVRPAHQWMLDSITETPAYLGNARMDILATNVLAEALYLPIIESPVAGRNIARYVFLDPSSAQFFQQWTKIAEDTAASLRMSATRFANEPEVSNLIGELSTKSEYFRTLWARADVRQHTTGQKTMVHPEVGELLLGFEGMQLASDDFMKVVIYNFEPGTPTAERVKLLGSLQATKTRI